MKYITIERSQVGANSYVVANKRYGDRLGRITYFQGWRQFVFQPAPNTEFSADCLTDIQNFMLNLKAETSQCKLM